jgi:hypothetical protein
VSDRGKRALALLKRCKEIRSHWEGYLQEAYDYTMPQKEHLFSRTPGQKQTVRIFDETAVVGVQELASRIQAGVMPPFAEWSKLAPGSDTDEEEREEITQALAPVNTYIAEAIQHSASAGEIHEALLDCSVSVGCLCIERGTPAQPLRVMAIPIARLYIDCAPDGSVDTICVPEHVRLSKVRLRWPKAKFSEELKKAILDAGEVGKPDDPVEFAVVTVRVPGPEEAWERVVVHPTGEVIMHEKWRGIGSCPYVVFRWAKLSGEVWGRGPVLNVLPAIKTVNLTMQLILENAEMAVTGMFQAEDDGVINPDTIQIVPGTIIPHAAGSQGLRPIQPAGDFDVGNLILSEMRANIRRGLYNEQMGNMQGGKTPLSATEVAERQADLSRQIGSAFARLVHELVNPFVKRCVFVLKEMGLLSLPPVNNRTLGLIVTSPLAKAQEFQHITAFDRFAEQIAMRFGPQVLNLMVDQDKAGPGLAKLHGVAPDWLRSKAEQKQLAQQMAQMDPNGADPNGQAAPV